MLLVADETQDIYERSDLWTEASMKGCGLSKSWVRLENSYRVPSQLIPLLKDFAERFIPEKSVDLPNGQLELLPCSLRWRQTIGNGIVDACLEEIIQMAGIKLPQIVPFSDVIVAVSSKALGIALIRRLTSSQINVTQTFDMKSDPDNGKQPDGRQERRRNCISIKATLE